MNNLSSSAFLPLPFLERNIHLREGEHGVLYMKSRVPLGPVARNLPGVLSGHADRKPDAIWLKQRREAGDGWREISYGQAWYQARAVGQALLEMNPRGRSVMVLSGNSIEHAIFEMGAMLARIPYVPVTPAYSLLSTDFAKLRSMVELVEPGVIFVQHGGRFARALSAVAGPDVRVVVVDGDVPEKGLAWQDLVVTRPGQAVEDSLARIDHDVVAKYLFTSGSTGIPKAVPVTQGMLCSTMVMHAKTVGRSPTEGSSQLLEWLPWSHVAGGTAIFNSVLEDGGTMHLDDGRPTPEDFGRTIANLREVSPTRFSSVPVGFAMLADALDRDEVLATSFFKNLRRLTSSGAKMPDAVYQRLQSHAVRRLGARIPFVSSYGSTETCAATTVVHWPVERAGLVGLPQPGVELKLVPLEDGRYEVRVKGPSVMSGYVAQPELNQKAFDEEGYFGMGDALSFVDPAKPEEGLAFAGRVAEEFKLQSGIFVRVGSLRVEVINAMAPYVTDAVVTGADRPYVSLLVWLNEKACADQFGSGGIAALKENSELRKLLKERLQAHNKGAGSSMRIHRVLVLAEPASMDAGEITDKGYVNQRKVLELRSAAVEALYAEPPGAELILVEGGQHAG